MYNSTVDNPLSEDVVKISVHRSYLQAAAGIAGPATMLIINRELEKLSFIETKLNRIVLLQGTVYARDLLDVEQEELNNLLVTVPTDWMDAASLDYIRSFDRQVTSCEFFESLLDNSRRSMLTLQKIVKTAESAAKKLWTKELVGLKAGGYALNFDRICVLEKKLNDASEKFIAERLCNYIMLDTLNSEKMMPWFLRIAKENNVSDLSVIAQDDGTPFLNLDERSEHITGFYESLYKLPVSVPENFINCVSDFLGDKKTGHGKDWAEAGEAVAVERASFLVPDDDRLLFNSNSFNLEKGRNVSRSFDLDGNCVTCQTGPHSAVEGKDGKPVVFCLADQHFTPAAPAADGKECMRILRVEDASLRELTSEFLDWLKGKELVVGCVVLLGSVYQLSVDGTAQYVDDWHHCQRRLKEAVEGLLVLPLIPIPLEGVKDKETVRSLLEFFLWFEDLPDVEAKLMADTREDLKKSFLGRLSEGPGWCDDRQSMRLPLSLNGQGKATKANRLLGDRPKTIVPFDRDLERVWIAKMAADLNKGFNLGLSSDLLLYRTAEDLCRARKNDATVLENR